MTQRRRFLLLISSLAMIGYFGYTYMYKDHRDIKTEVSEIEIVAPYLLERFKNDDGNDYGNDDDDDNDDSGNEILVI